MLKTDVLKAIEQQTSLLEQEIVDIEKQKNSRSCVTGFFNSLVSIFRNELEIKRTKLNALKNLHTEVAKDNFKSVHDFDTYVFDKTQAKYSSNKGLVFSGFFNRTQKLFNLVRSYLTEQQSVQITNQANNSPYNKL